MPAVVVYEDKPRMLILCFRHCKCRKWGSSTIPGDLCMIHILALVFKSFQAMTCFRRGQIACKEKGKTRGSRRKSISNSVTE